MSSLGTDTHDMEASSFSCTMVTLCATLSLGMLIIPGTRNVALTFPLDDTDKPRYSIALAGTGGAGIYAGEAGLCPREVVSRPIGGAAWADCGIITIMGDRDW